MECDVRNDDAWFHLGEALRGVGARAEAIDAFRKVIAIGDARFGFPEKARRCLKESEWSSPA